jgi:hypothetical protein
MHPSTHPPCPTHCSYVSFAEIFLRKSVDGFTASGMTDIEAYRYATLGFFGGMLIIALLDQLVHLVVKCSDRRDRRKKRVALASSANLLAHAAQQSDGGLAPECESAAGAAPAPAAPMSRQPPPEPAAAPELSSESGKKALPAQAAAAEPEPEPAVCVLSMGGDDELPDLEVEVERATGGGQHDGSTSRQPPAVVEIMEGDEHAFALKRMGE